MNFVLTGKFVSFISFSIQFTGFGNWLRKKNSFLLLSRWQIQFFNLGFLAETELPHCFSIYNGIRSGQGEREELVITMYILRYISYPQFRLLIFCSALTQSDGVIYLKKIKLFFCYCLILTWFIVVIVGEWRDCGVW